MKFPWTMLDSAVSGQHNMICWSFLCLYSQILCLLRNSKTCIDLLHLATWESNAKDLQLGLLPYTSHCWFRIGDGYYWVYHIDPIPIAYIGPTWSQIDVNPLLNHGFWGCFMLNMLTVGWFSGSSSRVAPRYDCELDYKRLSAHSANQRQEAQAPQAPQTPQLALENARCPGDVQGIQEPIADVWIHHPMSEILNHILRWSHICVCENIWLFGQLLTWWSRRLKDLKGTVEQLPNTLIV
jgi:hypothetical protein